MKHDAQNFILRKASDLERSRDIGRVVEHLESLPLDHNWKVSVWKVSVEEKKSARSLELNAYYWGCVVEMISQATGYEPEEVHEHLCGSRWGWKDKRVPKTPRNPLGIVSKPVRTTTTDADGRRSVLGTAQFMDFIEFARRFAAEKVDLVIPDPDPNWRSQAA